MHTRTSKNAWKAFCVWAVVVGISFFSVYPVCNWLTAQRGDTLPLYWVWELRLPFVPEFVWAYLSMYILFIMPPFFLDPPDLAVLGKRLVAGTLSAGFLFLVFPAKLGYTRDIPADQFYGSLFAGMFRIDMPHNLVPSLHVIYSAAIVCSLLIASKTVAARVAWLAWLSALCASTVLVHQHHMLDVVAGLAVALLVCRFIGKGESNA